MYKCKTGVLSFLYRFFPHPIAFPKKETHKSFRFAPDPVINHQQFFLPPLHSPHLCLYFDFPVGMRLFAAEKCMRILFPPLISMERRCRAELHPAGALAFSLYKQPLSLSLASGSAKPQHLVICFCSAFQHLHCICLFYSL